MGVVAHPHVSALSQRAKILVRICEVKKIVLKKLEALWCGG